LFRCLLKPDSNDAAGVDGWQVLNDSRLVNMACQRLGMELMNKPYSQWTVFYQEFLNHLKGLSKVGMVSASDNNIDYVTENFATLTKV